MNRVQKLTAILCLTTIASSANAAPPESLNGLVLGASIQEVKGKHGPQMRLSTKWKEDLADSRCGIDKYEIDLPEFFDEQAYFYNGKLFAIRMKMEAVLTMPEMFALAKRFVGKYGQPSWFLCVYSNEPAIETHSITDCEFKPSILLTYESGVEGLTDRHEFWINIYSTAKTRPDVQGYSLNLMRGWKYYHETTESCRKRALLAIDKENAAKITLPD